MAQKWLIEHFWQSSVDGALAAVDVLDLPGDEWGVLQIEDASTISSMGVRITPSATALARMPRSAYSMASDLTAALRPPLVDDANTEGTLELA